MKSAIWYRLFEPLRGGLSDDPQTPMALEVKVSSEKGQCELAVKTDANGAPEFSRVTVHGLVDEKASDEFVPLVQMLQEHLLSVLRLTYSGDLDFAPMSMLIFRDEGADRSAKVLVDVGSLSPLNSELTKSLFVHSMPLRNELRLLVDGNDGRIPVQYRFLALYKLLEHDFKTKGHWRHEELRTFLSGYLGRFVSLGFKGDPTKHLHSLRDACAHIKTGKTREIFGVTSLDHKKHELVSSFLPVLRDACQELINKKARGVFALGDIRSWPEQLSDHLSAHKDVSARR